MSHEEAVRFMFYKIFLLLRYFWICSHLHQPYILLRTVCPHIGHLLLTLSIEILICWISLWYLFMAFISWLKWLIMVFIKIILFSSASILFVPPRNSLIILFIKSIVCLVISYLSSPSTYQALWWVPRHVQLNKKTSSNIFSVICSRSLWLNFSKFNQA